MNLTSRLRPGKGRKAHQKSGKRESGEKEKGGAGRKPRFARRTEGKELDEANTDLTLASRQTFERAAKSGPSTVGASHRGDVAGIEEMEEFEKRLRLQSL